jgi:hypothetical protein
MNDWTKEWVDMPEFHVPTRDTEKRNKIDVSDVKEISDRKTSKQPRYPIYIISKGRANNSQTAKALDSLGIDYKVVIEPVDYNDYIKTIDKAKILQLPFSDLGQGSIPARNWVLEYSISQGEKKHWILDDNINGFGYQKSGRRVNTKTNGDLFVLLLLYNAFHLVLL